MSFAPSITDILELCKFAWNTTVKLKNAPSDLSEIAHECETYYQLLSQVDQELKDPFSPVQVDDNGRQFMQQYIPECSGTLYSLQLKCSKYEKMGVRERVGFIAAEFGKPRQEMEKQRNNINLQMHFGTHNMLSLIFKQIYHLSKDVRAGRRCTVVSGRGTAALSNVADPEAKDLIKEEVLRSAPGLPVAAIDQNWQAIESYVEMLQARGGFDELYNDAPTILPSDSISDVGERASSPRAMSSVGVTEMGWPDHYRGIPIEEASSWTILNPATDFVGHDRPDTCDIWGVAVACTKLRNLCMHRIRELDDPYGGPAHSLRSLHELLCTFTPALLLTIARSSSDRDFWAKLRLRPEIVRTGRKLLSILKELLKEFEYQPSLSVPSNTSLLEVPVHQKRRLSLRKLKDSFRSSSVGVEELASPPPELNEIISRSFSSTRIQCRNFASAFGGIRTEECTYLSDSCGPGLWSKQEFELEINFYLSRWWSKSSDQTPGDLLENWLLASQGIDVQKVPRGKSGMEMLLDQLHLQVDRKWTESLNYSPNIKGMWARRKQKFEVQEGQSRASSDRTPRTSHQEPAEESPQARIERKWVPRAYRGPQVHQVPPAVLVSEAPSQPLTSPNTSSSPSVRQSVDGFYQGTASEGVIPSGRVVLGEEAISEFADAGQTDVSKGEFVSSGGPVSGEENTSDSSVPPKRAMGPDGETVSTNVPTASRQVHPPLVFVSGDYKASSKKARSNETPSIDDAEVEDEEDIFFDAES